jgi:hypothetical protein
MWTMTVIHSENILLEDIYVNSTGNEPVGFDFSSLNTDGADTVYANNITFRRWNVTNGDDSIALKANSTNILIEDCDFYMGLGVAIGSIGQYNNTFEIIENVTARDIRSYNMRYGAYVKTCSLNRAVPTKSLANLLRDWSFYWLSSQRRWWWPGLCCQHYVLRFCSLQQYWYLCRDSVYLL